MEFSINKASIASFVKIAKFPIFKYAFFFKNLFFIFFVLSLVGVTASFFEFGSGNLAFRVSVLLLVLYIIFWDFQLFLDLKIKRPQLSAKLSDAAASPDDYNLAEFLDFDAAKIVLDSIHFCKRKKISINSTALLYAAIKHGGDINLICFRLGLIPKDLESDLKNYLEKIPKHDGLEQVYAEDFKETITEAAEIAVLRKHEQITEKDILAALPKFDDFFKKILVKADLKPADVENLTLWIDSAERLMQENRQFWSKENLMRMGSRGKDWASGYTINLDKYSTDWRKIVSTWNFREIIGHKKEIEQAEIILAKSSLANVLIVGEPGTGRKSIIEALAQKCYLSSSLPELNNKRVVELDVTLLAATVQDFERLELMLDQIFSEAIAAGNVILVIDELQNYVGQKVQKAGAVDISGILSKYLAIPSFQFIGITSYAGLHKDIEQNPSFAEFFRKVEVGEITEAETIQILQSAALESEYKRDLLILYPSIREIVNLTARYMPSLPFPKKALDVLDEVSVYVESLKEKIVLPHHVAELISKKTEIPVGKMETKEKEVLLNLENLIHNRIVNQSEAVSQISIAMRRARMGIASKKRPMGTFLFMGPTGVGKTETAKALAQIYFGSEEKMIRLDMSEFQAVADIPRLIGAVSPIEMQGILTTPVRETPFSLVLVDEIEKAHPNILNLFLQILDEGHITDGQGRKVMFTNTIIICTSNAGAGMIFKEVESGEKVDKDKLINTLVDNGTFKPEFINRFDATVVFHPLTKENLMQIAQLSLQGLQKNLKEKEINFQITDALKEKIVELSYKPEFGAREMRRVVQDKVENAIAQALLSDAAVKGDTITVDPENFTVAVNPVK